MSILARAASLPEVAHGANGLQGVGDNEGRKDDKLQHAE